MSLMQITDRMFGRIVRTEDDPEEVSQRGRNYDWRCIAGPPEFTGNLFRQTDITNGGFPSGTIFQNIKDPQKVHIV